MRNYRFVLLLSLFPVAPAFAQGTSGMYKCIVAGKIIYSDHVCGKPGSVTEVKIYHAKGAVSPDRQTVADACAHSGLNVGE